MRPEVGASYRSPRAPLTDPEAARTTRRALEAGPICLLPRQLDPAVAAALDGLAADDLPRFDVSGTPAHVRAAVTAALPPSDPVPVLDWLRDDILGLAAHYAAAIGCRTLRARLQVVADNMCRAFHVDNVTVRLVTTYRGPGTQWLAPRHLQAAQDGQALGPEAIRQMPRGAVAFMRGGRDASAERPGLLHRSPPIADTGAVRLFLAIDETGL